MIGSDADMRRAILAGQSASELRSLSVNRGMQTLERSAIAKVRRGITTLEEMHRVLIVS